MVPIAARSLTVKIAVGRSGPLSNPTAAGARHSAIADLGWIRFSGRLAWFFWLFVHIMYLVGFRNRVVVFIEWAYSYFTYQPGVRLITDVERYKPPVSARAV